MPTTSTISPATQRSANMICNVICIRAAAVESSACEGGSHEHGVALRRLDRLQLLEMMDVVAGHLRSHPLRGELTVLRMCERTRSLGRRHVAEHQDIQLPQRRVCAQRGARICLFVEWKPVVLRERLRHIAVLARGKSNARCQRKLRLREMDDDLPRRPLLRRIALFPLRHRPALNEGANAVGSLGKRRERIEGSEILRVWILGHGADGSTPGYTRQRPISNRQSNWRSTIQIGIRQSSVRESPIFNLQSLIANRRQKPGLKLNCH